MSFYFHQFQLKFRKSECGVFFCCFQIAVVEEDGREDKATIKCETSPPPTPRAIRMTHTLPSSYHNDARRYDLPSTLPLSVLLSQIFFLLVLSDCLKFI